MHHNTGTLRKNPNNRWEIVQRDGHKIELSSGSVIQVQIAKHWLTTRIEFDGKTHEYYAVTKGLRLAIGLAARLPE